MPTLFPPVELTRKVRIVYDDGTDITVEMTPGLARSIRDMENAEKAKEKRHQRREPTFTDAKVTAKQIAHGQGKRPNPKAGMEKPGRWEGPRPVFTLHLGYSALWSGPDSLTVVRNGRHVCRFCSGIRRMPEIACCLGCDRTGKG